MTPEQEQRFHALTKMRSRRRIKRFKQEFINLSNPAKELFLQIHADFLYSESPCKPQDFVALVDLGYSSSRQVNDARISPLKIIEFHLRQEYVPLLRKFLHPRYVPDAEMVEAFKSGSVEKVEEIACRSFAKSYYR
jgi:hypothetical protein